MINPQKHFTTKIANKNKANFTTNYNSKLKKGTKQ